VTTPFKRLKMEEAKAEQKFRENVGTALERLSKASHMHAYTAICEKIRNTWKEVADYHIRYLTASDEPLKAALDTYKTKSEATLSTLEEQLEDMQENWPIS
jgi:arginyl-tRNA synthetase